MLCLSWLGSFSGSVDKTVGQVSSSAPGPLLGMQTSSLSRSSSISVCLSHQNVTNALQTGGWEIRYNTSLQCKSITNFLTYKSAMIRLLAVAQAVIMRGDVLPGSETFAIHECTSHSSAESRPRPFEQRRIETSIRVERSTKVTLSTASHYMHTHSYTPHSRRLVTWRTLGPFLGSPRGGSEIGITS
jgi:hypothetical protein